MKKQGYIAGKLFKDGDIKQRLYEEEVLKKELPGIKFHNPINDPDANDKSKNPTAEKIFFNDTLKILESDYIIAELDDFDEGVMVEIGICIGVNYMLNALLSGISIDDIRKKIPYKNILAHCSDIRLDSKGYEGIYMPYGLNQYCIGGLDLYGKVFRHFEDIVNYIKKEELEINEL